MAKAFDGPAKQAGEFLRKELKRRGISQAKFAESVYCDERTVRRWIHDGIHQLETLFLIVEFFRLKSIGDIFLEQEDVPSFFTQ